MPETTQKVGVVTVEEWRAEAARLFGPDPMGWRFVCPVCGHVASVQDWKDAGAPEGEAAFSCVGRWLDQDVRAAFLVDSGPDVESPCDYTGGGLFRLNPVKVLGEDGEEHATFAFAEPEEASDGGH